MKSAEEKQLPENKKKFIARMHEEARTAAGLPPNSTLYKKDSAEEIAFRAKWIEDRDRLFKEYDEQHPACRTDMLPKASNNQGWPAAR